MLLGWRGVPHSKRPPPTPPAPGGETTVSGRRRPEPELPVALVLEPAGVVLDDQPGRDIGDITGDQRRIDAHLVGNRERGGEHRGRVAPAAGRGADVVADVAAGLEQGRGEAVADRDSAE